MVCLRSIISPALLVVVLAAVTGCHAHRTALVSCSEQSGCSSDQGP